MNIVAHTRPRGFMRETESRRQLRSEKQRERTRDEPGVQFLVKNHGIKMIK